jgi:hypothetical protein
LKVVAATLVGKILNSKGEKLSMEELMCKGENLHSHLIESLSIKVSSFAKSEPKLFMSSQEPFSKSSCT